MVFPGLSQLCPCQVASSATGSINGLEALRVELSHLRAPDPARSQQVVHHCRVQRVRRTLPILILILILLLQLRHGAGPARGWRRDEGRLAHQHGACGHSLGRDDPATSANRRQLHEGNQRPLAKQRGRDAAVVVGSGRQRGLQLWIMDAVASISAGAAAGLKLKLRLGLGLGLGLAGTAKRGEAGAASAPGGGGCSDGRRRRRRRHLTIVLAVGAGGGAEELVHQLGSARSACRHVS